MSSILSIHNLTYAYPDEYLALRGITLEAAEGEKIALVGPNGAGKSTLLQHLNGILSPAGGKISVNHLEMNSKNLANIRALVGVVFQNPDDQLFSPTVFEDVAYGPIYQGLSKLDVEKRVKQALDAVQMSEYIHRVSYHLSVGEKKKIAIATVLAMQPSILALDEPSAGLDPRARRGLIQLLETLPQTQIIATHDLALVKELADRVLIMDKGVIVADGDTKTILADTHLLEAHGIIA